MPATPAAQHLLESMGCGPLPDWHDVEDRAAILSCAPGSTVFAQGVAHPYVYVVRSGLVKLCYLSVDGNEWIKSFAEEGRFFASVAALTANGVTSFMAQALEPAVLERLDYRVLGALAQRHLVWSQTLHAATRVFAARKEQREHDLLTLTAEARFRAFAATQPDLVARVPQKDLARYLGVTPIGLNRIVQRVRRASAGAGQDQNVSQSESPPATTDVDTGAGAGRSTCA